MSRFVCTTCNREFTTKYGLQKHSHKKIPCKAEKITKYQCDKCNIYLSSKRNLDDHLFNHRLDHLKISNTNPNIIGDNNLEDNIVNNNLEENNLEDNLEDNLINNLNINIIPNNSIEITIEEYNYFKSLENKLYKSNNENQQLKNEIKKLNTIINTTNNIDNSITNNDNSTNITNNIQINIIPFHDASINYNDIVESFKDPNSALYDFSKIFNYDHLNYPKQQNGLNFSQSCKNAKLRKIVANHRKRDISLVSRGFIDILSRHFSRPEYKNIKQITRNMYKLYNGNGSWILITLDDTKKELHKKVVNSMADNNIPNSIPRQSENAVKFIKNDYYKNHQEYEHYHNNEFISMVKNIIPSI
jgi:hypothetical protein